MGYYCGIDVRNSDEGTFFEKVEKAMVKLPPLAQRGIKELLRAFDLLHMQQRRLYKERHKGMRENEVTRRLQTIPGVGPATAAAFV